MIFDHHFYIERRKAIDIGLFVVTFFAATQVYFHFDPGALSPDSLSILRQARSGIYYDAQPPLLALLWSIFDRVTPGPRSILILNLLLLYGGLFLIFLKSTPRKPVIAVPLLLIVALFPPIVGILGAIWIDVTMAGFLLFAVGIFMTLNRGESRRAHIIAIVPAVILCGLAIAVRHNGAPAALPLITAFLLLSSGSRSTAWFRLLFIGIAGILLTIILYICAQMLSAWVVSTHQHA